MSWGTNTRISNLKNAIPLVPSVMKTGRKEREKADCSHPLGPQKALKEKLS